MICSSPSLLTPDAELALLPATTKGYYDTCINCSLPSLQWRQSKSDTASLSIFRERELQERETLVNANGSHRVAQKGAQKVEVTLITDDSSRAGAIKDITLGALLKACSERRDLLCGTRIHAEIIKHGLFENNIYLGCSLVNLYAKCGALEIAEAVFEELPARSIVSWNSLIGGYAQCMHTQKAFSCYSSMQQEGFFPNKVTFLSVLKACASIDVSDESQVIHAQIIKAGLLEDICISTALLNTYAKSGALEKAQQVFSSLIVRDVVAWTALILGYAEHECGEEALECYEQMQLEGLTPDAVTAACLLKACGSIGSAYEGQMIHAELVRSEMLEKDMVAGSALVDMYANCGMLAEAQGVFDSLPVKNVVSWSALMEGYAQLGKDEVVFGLFDRMIRSGSRPTLVTFTILLNACCHRGLLDKGMSCFERLIEEYNMIPTVEHHSCMVDLFCRAGHLDKVMVMIRELPVYANIVLWKTLLDACQKCGNTKLGGWTFGRVVELNDADAAAYVCMSNFTSIKRLVKTMR